MIELRNLKIRFWMNSIVGMVFVCLIIGGVLSVYRTLSLVNLSKRIYHYPVAVQNAIHTIETHLLTMHIQLTDMLSDETHLKITTYITFVTNLSDIIEDQLNVIAERFQGHEALSKNIIEAYQSWKPFIGRMLQKIQQGDITAAKRIYTESKESMDQFIFKLNQLAKSNENQAESCYLSALVHKKISLFTIILIVSLMSSLIIIIPILFYRSFSKGIMLASNELQLASEELTNSAKLQSTSTTEQVISSAEITTSMDELVNTSRRINKRAKDVVKAAEMTNNAAFEGNDSLRQAVQEMIQIKSQVDTVVQNMSSLGDRTQKMGLALQIVNDLTEQTTILSYNATIEAVGAGEAGKRFSAIAEQIRKLANKAANSTKEIKNMIEHVQKSTNTAIRLTEETMKIVSIGSQHIQNSREHFDRILEAAQNNLDAAQDIESHISRQSAAVEQTSQVIRNIEKTAKAIQDCSSQILQIGGRVLSISRRK
ncbi:MAG: MCP four helix bundle domain-containing protein [Desulfobacterales bacterium]|nr:MCP four helix bundle domain-containing protein [Desulfobacterales bacterium]